MGTTAQLDRWFDALATCINSRGVPPAVVALALSFLDAPNPEAYEALANPTAADLQAASGAGAINTGLATKP